MCLFKYFQIKSRNLVLYWTLCFCNWFIYSTL